MAKNPIHLPRLRAALSARSAVTAPPEVSPPPLAGEAKPKLLHQRFTEGSVLETMDRWSAEGGTLTASHLMKKVRALCKSRRPKEALEVMDWMARRNLEISSGSEAFRLHLLLRVEGIDSAEKHFFSLPDSAKNQRTYNALLYCYCRKRMADKAISLYAKMRELNLNLDVFTYNNLMSLHMKLGQHEETVCLFGEMKLSGTSPDNCSYRILMKSYTSMNDMGSVERCVHEMEGSGVRLDWFTYCSLAEIYNSTGLFEKAEIALKKAELVMDGRECLPFLLLIKLYAEAGNLAEVKMAWGRLKTRTRRPNNEQYLIMLQALKKLGDMDSLRNCFGEWEAGRPHFDARIVNMVIEAMLDNNMVKEAQLLQEEYGERDVHSDLHDE